ncbi:UNVERIFIED_ORG: multidrug resistance efflux pump [Arthrobacter sp. UYEF10]
MAAPRKSATQVAARTKARAKAQELTARHERLIDLAAEFFEQQEQAEQVRADARAKAEALLARAEEEAAAATAGAAGTVAAMLAAGEPKASVAARLGITGAELKKLLDQAPAATGPAASEQSDGAAEVQEETAAEAA